MTQNLGERALKKKTLRTNPKIVVIVGILKKLRVKNQKKTTPRNRVLLKENPEQKLPDNKKAISQNKNLRK